MNKIVCRLTTIINGLCIPINVILLQFTLCNRTTNIMEYIIAIVFANEKRSAISGNSLSIKQNILANMRN